MSFISPTSRAPHPLRAMEDLDDALASASSGYTGSARWMIPYADLMTLLLGFFIILFAMITMENKSLTETVEKLQTEKPAPASALIQSDKLYTPPAGSLSDADVSVDILEASLGKELKLAGEQVTVSQDARGLVLSFQDRIFFGPGSASLSHEAQATLDKLAGILAASHHPIRVEGHTDNTPIKTSQFPSNWELSTARSTAIVRSLMERHHFDPKQLSAAGYGEYSPLAENSTIEGKQKNRRVDIVLLNPLMGGKAVENTDTPTDSTVPAASGTGQVEE